MDNAGFAAFESFDFECNATFQKGWSSLKTLFVSDAKAMEREYLKAKAFFFSKYIQSFDFEKYKAWKSENKQKTSTEDIGSEVGSSDSCSRTGRDISRHCDNVPDSLLIQKAVKESKHLAPLIAGDLSKEKNNESVQGKQENQCSEKNPPDIDGSKSCQKKEERLEDKNENDDDEKEQKEDCLSLAELAMLVQNGLPIPGLISVDVQPTNKDPTPSTMSRKPKPWEMKKNEENISEKESQGEA